MQGYLEPLLHCHGRLTSGDEARGWYPGKKLVWRRMRNKKNNQLTCSTECPSCLSFRRTGFEEVLNPDITGQSKATDSERLLRRPLRTQRMLEVRWRLSPPVWLQLSVYKELHSKMSPIPPRDNHRPLKDPSGRQTCRLYVPWPLEQPSTS